MRARLSSAAMGVWRGAVPILSVWVALAGCDCSGSGAGSSGQTTSPDVASTKKPAAADSGTDSGADSDKKVLPERLRVVVHARHPHDRDAFTQGLVYSNGRLFESTGREGFSSVREVDLQTGRVLRRRDNTPDIFAEGLALVDDQFIQLTWQNGVAFTYKKEDFAPVREYHYETEGWGLCFDGEKLIMSDGSARLFFRDPRTFALRNVMSVWQGERPLKNLNELECVGDHVYANVWQTDEIVRIRKRDGVVDAIIDARGLLTSAESEGVDVLNGIAFIPDSGHFLLTGKLWPALFEVTFEPARP